MGDKNLTFFKKKVGQKFENRNEVAVILQHWWERLFLRRSHEKIARARRSSFSEAAGQKGADFKDTCKWDVEKAFPDCKVTGEFCIAGHDVRKGRATVEKWLNGLTY